MAKVLLINPGFYLEKAKKVDQYIFPFGLGYIAAYAEKNGHKIDVWDIYISHLSMIDVKEKIKDIDLSSYDWIGITGIVNQYLYIKKLCELIKNQTNIKIILGGPLSSYSYEIVLKNTDVDICVIGEGEITFLELLNGKNISEIDGIAYKKDHLIIKNKMREQIRNIDEIGFPAYHLFNMEYYLKHTGMMDVVRHYYKNKNIISLFTSRGCPYDCKFCSKSVKGIRMKSLDFLFKEIEYCQKVFNIQAIHFIDELLLLNKKRFLEFCKRIKKYNIVWDCQGRINLADLDILKAMKEANGICIGFGIESGSQKILDLMNKKINVSDILNVLSSCIKINLAVKMQLIYGYPSESIKTLNETISLFKKLKLPSRRFTVITPLPGAHLYEEAIKDGFIGENDSNLISEVDYLEFLSRSSGKVTHKLFYNRTEFSNDMFFVYFRKMQNFIFLNFIKTFLFHPFFVLKHWSNYKVYLRNWWETYNKGLFFKTYEIIKDFFKNPLCMFKS